MTDSKPLLLRMCPRTEPRSRRRHQGRRQSIPGKPQACAVCRKHGAAGACHWLIRRRCLKARSASQARKWDVLHLRVFALFRRLVKAPEGPSIKHFSKTIKRSVCSIDRRCNTSRWAPLRRGPRKRARNACGGGIFDRRNGEFSLGLET